MIPNKIKPAFNESGKQCDLYSPQFEYKGLYDRLSHIKHSQKKTPKTRQFSSFDLSWVPIKPLKNPKRRSSNSIKNPSTKNKENHKNTSKPKHKRNLTNHLIQSDLIPLISPGFTIYYNQNKPKSRRHSITS